MQPLQNLRSARWYDSHLYTIHDGFNFETSINVFAPATSWFDYVYGTSAQVLFPKSLVVRGNRICITTFGSSACFAMKKPCP